MSQKKNLPNIMSEGNNQLHYPSRNEAILPHFAKC